MGKYEFEFTDEQMASYQMVYRHSNPDKTYTLATAEEVIAILNKDLCGRADRDAKAMVNAEWNKLTLEKKKSTIASMVKVVEE